MSNISAFSEKPFYKQFEEYLKEKYPEDYNSFTQDQIDDYFENIFMMGLRQAKKFLNNKKSCDILFEDKPPRADMMQKLGNILWELEDIESYPTRVPPMKITSAIKKVLSSRDSRTQLRYRDWIMQYSHHLRQFNSVDLTQLVSLFPKNLIRQGGIW